MLTAKVNRGRRRPTVLVVRVVRVNREAPGPRLGVFTVAACALRHFRSSTRVTEYLIFNRRRNLELIVNLIEFVSKGYDE